MQQSLFRTALSTAALCAVVFAGCDSDDPVDPPPVQTAFCTDNPSAFGCDDSGVRYDTLDADDDADDIASRFPTLSTDADIIVVTDLDGGIGGEEGDDPRDDVDWSNDYEYILDGYVYVNSGQTLDIEEGTVIRGDVGTGDDASALIVARGGRIEAEGTASEPIIMTAVGDDLDDNTDLTPDGIQSNERWGGLIVLGAAPSNISVGEAAVEGITANNRTLYGGTNPNDDSGIIRYVSIRFGGVEIAPNNEINGLTLGAVGAGTTIEYVEVFANQDDCVEWFGGTAQAKYLVGAFCGDDMYDYDLGYSGNNQFVFGLMANGFGDNGGEHDGGDRDLSGSDDAMPFAIPTFANVTYLGSGETAANDSRVFIFRDNAGGNYYNSVFGQFARGLEIEDRSGTDSGDSRARLEGNDLVFGTNVWFQIGAGSTFSEIVEITEDDVDDNPDTPDEPVDPAFADFVAGNFTANNNALVSSNQLVSIAREANGGLDPRLASGSEAAGTAPATVGGGFFDTVSYIGAFGQTNWLEGWTALDQLGYLAD